MTYSEDVPVCQQWTFYIKTLESLRAQIGQTDTQPLIMQIDCNETNAFI